MAKAVNDAQIGDHFTVFVGQTLADNNEDLALLIMRYGSSGNLTATQPDKTGIETIEKLKKFGYDYIELPLSEIMDLPQERREAIVARVDASGIKSEVLNNLFPRRMKLTGPDVDREAISKYYRKALPLAKRLGAEYVVFGSPFAKSYPLGFDKAQALEQLASLHQEVDEYAGSIGLRILIEPIHSFESNLINTFAEGVEFKERLNLRHTDVLLDYYHMTRDHENPKILLTLGRDNLRHIHFACPFLPGEGERVFPLYENEWPPYTEFTAILKDIGYNGRISLEARTSDFDDHAPRALRVLHALFD